MREPDDPLFTGRGPLPEDLARLEHTLAKLPIPPEPDWDAEPASERRRPIWAYAVAAAAVFVAVAGAQLASDAWRVETLAGAPSLGGIAFGGRVALGGRIATDEHSRARLEVPGLGRVDLDPGSVLRRVPGRGTERTLALDHGTLHAFIQAPPRQFIVRTPVGVATDLGCAYTLQVDRGGSGRLSVTSGRVTFTHGGLESFVPAGAWCPLLASGVGVPRRDYASDAFLAAIAAYDSRGPAPALERVLSAPGERRDRAVAPVAARAGRGARPGGRSDRGTDRGAGRRVARARAGAGSRGAGRLVGGHRHGLGERMARGSGQAGVPAVNR
jgi:hypothetical protein